jgi:hypothetical protein
VKGNKKRKKKKEKKKKKGERAKNEKIDVPAAREHCNMCHVAAGKRMNG